MDQLGLEVISPLNWIDYKYDVVKHQIVHELGWREYGGKHYESVFTRFYQGFILPEKFGIDKRRAHFSTLICSGQMSREQALDAIAKPGYADEQLQIDKPFVLKKLGFSEAQFDDYISSPRVEHADFGKELSFYERYPVLKPLRPLVNALLSRR